MSPIMWLRLGAFAAALLALWWVGSSIYGAGEAAERARWQRAQAAADAKQLHKNAKARDTSDSVQADTRDTAAEAVADTRTETVRIVERVRYETRRIEVPADCPVHLPDSVRDAGRAAVDRARAAQGGPLPAAGHAGSAGLAR